MQRTVVEIDAVTNRVVFQHTRRDTEIVHRPADDAAERMVGVYGFYIVQVIYTDPIRL